MVPSLTVTLIMGIHLTMGGLLKDTVGMLFYHSYTLRPPTMGTHPKMLLRPMALLHRTILL
uniref:Uncharacterized protein n=1 Tax=Picea glauca TaxID=3330 RepID=A0A124GNW3_PICGL|nr:hypothetical protein ABT39_MTgene3321 [Picea glauca]QHR88573.1 hypothetical protein Q903MT_gene2587 [Picea sitchensis]